MPDIQKPDEFPTAEAIGALESCISPREATRTKMQFTLEDLQVVGNGDEWDGLATILGIPDTETTH